MRDEVGGSVLRGTVLEVEPDEAKAEFDRSLRKVLGLPPDEVADQERQSPRKTPQEIVKILRVHGVHLDRIANDIEELKQYRHADQLRETARQLRLIARQFHD